MRILLTNDDGVYAEGIRALALELRQEHEIAIAAPDSQRSGAGHSFTCTRPIEVRKVQLEGLEDVPAFAVSGTPVDCVKLGCNNLGLAVDMVVSGINHGSNLGTDVLYSGTVGAAMEGALLGFPSIAVSSYSLTPREFTAAAKAARWAVGYLLKNPLPRGFLLNVNTPDLPIGAIKGVRTAPLCLQEYNENYTLLEQEGDILRFSVPNGKLTQFGQADDYDERWVREGYAVFTPLWFDITAHAAMKTMDLSGFSWE